MIMQALVIDLGQVAILKAFYRQALNKWNIGSLERKELFIWTNSHSNSYIIHIYMAYWQKRFIIIDHELT